MCYINDLVEDDTNGNDVNHSQFKQIECSHWCPSSICQVCSHFTKLNSSDVTSCGDDNRATQMGQKNSCRRSSNNQINKTWQTNGLACTCKEAGCYCYCITQNCICSASVSFRNCIATQVIIIGAFTLFVTWIKAL